MKDCLEGTQMLQDEAKDINKINSSRTNGRRTMPPDDLESVSRVECVNECRKDGENFGHRPRLQGADENQVNHMV
jgi:hypothetical protein